MCGAVATVLILYGALESVSCYGAIEIVVIIIIIVKTVSMLYCRLWGRCFDDK